MKVEDLIKICEDAVVPYNKWHDRDSYSAQMNIQDIYKRLKAGIEYTISNDHSFNSIQIDFKKPTETQVEEMKNHYLNIDSLEDYRKEYGYDDEMFNAYPDDVHSYSSGYLPTREKLNEVNGDDWY